MNFFTFRRRLGLAALPVFAGWFLLSRPALRAQDVRGFDTVIVDAGHGGHDRGGVPGQRGIAEKEATLDTARRLERNLRARGLRVVMTRTTDDFISLSQRVGATYSFNPRRTVFVSVHFNSAPREGARGIETYYYRGDSFALAARLHRELVADMNTEDRFVRRRPFYVIRRAAVPAVLLECGFLTNGYEENRIAGTRYRQQLADAISDGLIAQRRAGNLADIGGQPPVTTERRFSRGGGSGRSRRHHYASRHRGGGGRHARYSRSGRGGGGRHYSSGSHRGGRGKQAVNRNKRSRRRG